VIEKGLSVRETESMVRNLAEPAAAPTRRRSTAEAKDSDTRALEADLAAQLRMGVEIRHLGQDGGQLILTYRSLDQLDQLCQLLSGNS
jgi:ParB family transcriptional regulator, chromosome partitioning protein